MGFVDRSRSLKLAFAVCTAMTAQCLAQTVTDGNSTFTLDTSATFANISGATVRTGTGGGSTSVFNTGGITTTDHLFQTWWWYHVAGGTREFALSGRTGGSVAGNTITVNYTEPEGFTAELKYILTDGTDTPLPAANLGYSCKITNTTASPLVISLFNYTDFDLAGTLAGDSAVLLSPGLMEVTDASTQTKGQFLGVSPNFYQVLAFANLRTLLTDTTFTAALANTGLPFAAADFSGAYQWDLTIPANGNVTIRGALAINQTAVPPAGGPVCPADYNGVGGVTVQDIFDFLSDWFSNVPRADFNGAGGITVQDVFDFLTAWFAGCP